MRKRWTLYLILGLIAGLFLSGCAGGPEEDALQHGYGVFIGAGPESMAKMRDYEVVVVDAQYFSDGEIRELKKGGSKVYSYINIGSVENFRPYYADYEAYTLGVYENWEEERWVDVSCEAWQDFILTELAPGLLKKGVDGLLVDNADVYYYRSSEEIYDGVTRILQGLKSLNTYVCINGGDAYVTEYMERNGVFRDVADGVNQESVFSSIDWDSPAEDRQFSQNDPEEREYFQQYIETVAEAGGDVYLLEYTKDPELIRKIRKYCGEKGFLFYVSDSLELT